MRRFLWAVLVVLALAGAVAHAVTTLGYEAVTVTAAAGGVGFSTTLVNGTPQATMSRCRLETAEIRFTMDGTAPTAAVGTLLEVGDWLAIDGHDQITRFKAFRTTGTSGVLDCHHYAP